MSDLRLRLAQNRGLIGAILMFALLYGLYSVLHPRGGSGPLLVQNANESFALVLAAMAQTLPVLTGGLDLSVGPLMTLVNCLASQVLNGGPADLALGIALCLGAGLLGGFVNGCLVVYGRVQPIVATLASGAVFTGIALLLRPTPGGEIDKDLSFGLTYDLAELAATFGLFDDGKAPWFAPFAGLPTPVLLVVAIVVLVWLPFRASVTGRGCYAVGSSEGAAYMSGIAVDRSRLAAYMLAGLFAATAGLYLALQTGSGNADAPQAAAYTLNSIAAVVIGGTSLFGGSGGVVGSIFGALVLRAISFNFRVFDPGSWLGALADPLLQPFVEGLVLLLAVSLGAARVLRVRNRLHLFG
ncbi:ABC transporter permease [Arenibaculum pallidiluteum]|uniref:ABC transporter permease n=1 Tax=Arenibaculum pallidiluteum TaxID=2812559 RepID=UPI001A957F08|nr:ABC transporter permease [Arenibaculum pallidiluteum]